MDRGPGWIEFIAVAGGGALGSLLRYSVSLVATKTWGVVNGHWGTLAVNLGGCLLIGVFGGAVAMGFKPNDRWVGFIRAGILGGLTTFSAFGWEVFLLAEGERYSASFLHLILNVAGGVLLVALGYWLGKFMIAN